MKWTNMKFTIHPDLRFFKYDSNNFNDCHESDFKSRPSSQCNEYGPDLMAIRNRILIIYSILYLSYKCHNAT